MKDSSARVALITGGARGQGAAHAEALAEVGVRVVIAHVRDEDGARTAERLSARGLPVRYLHLDVTRQVEWTEVVRDVEATEGGLDVLVDNAGIIRVTSISALDLAEWELLQRVNTTSMLLGIQQAAPAIARRGGGSIINIASTAAHRGAVGYAAYAASKAAVLALTRAAALELAADGIRVNSISPGGVDTPMNDDEPPGGTSSGSGVDRGVEGLPGTSAAGPSDPGREPGRGQRSAALLDPARPGQRPARHQRVRRSHRALRRRHPGRVRHHPVGDRLPRQPAVPRRVPAPPSRRRTTALRRWNPARGTGEVLLHRADRPRADRRSRCTGPRPSWSPG